MSKGITYKYTYKGRLTDYHEMGMESVAVILEEDRGWHEEPSFNNMTKKYDGPMQKYMSMDWLYWLNQDDPIHIKVWNKEKSVVYSGPLTKKEGVTEALYNFVPNEVDAVEFNKWVRKGYRAVIKTNSPIGDDAKVKEDEGIPVMAGIGGISIK